MLENSSIAPVPDEDFSASKILIFLLTNLLAVATIFGNVLVILAIERHYRLHTITNVYLTSLAVTDLLVGVMAIYGSPFNILPWMDHNRYLCYSRMSVFIPSVASLLHLLAIASDRFMAIVYPLRYHDFTTRKRTQVIILLLWACSVVQFVLLIGTGRWDATQECSLFHVFSSPVLIVSFFCQFLVTTVIMLVIYGKIFHVAKAQAAKVNVFRVGALPGTTMSEPGRKQEKMAKISLRREMKAAKPLSIILGFFLVCYSGLFLVITLPTFGYYPEKFMSYYKTAVFMAFTNSLLNPLVYAGANRHFREAFRSILCRTQIKGPQEYEGAMDASTVI